MVISKPVMATRDSLRSLTVGVFPLPSISRVKATGFRAPIADGPSPAAKQRQTFKKAQIRRLMERCGLEEGMGLSPRVEGVDEAHAVQHEAALDFEADVLVG